MPDLFSPVPRAILGTFLVCIFLAAPGFASEQPNVAGNEPGSGTPLSLPEALARTLQHNPELAAWSEELRARDAEVLQAGLRPNPVLSLEAENLAGSGEFSGTKATETTVSLSQKLELGGKRARRQALAESGTAVAGREYDLARADTLARTTERFIAVLAAQERLQLADELLEVARRSLATVEERIAAGKAPATERVKARILVAELRAARGKTDHVLAAARRGLAAQMGREEADFTAVAGELDRLPHLLSLENLESTLDQSPELARRLAEVEQRRRAVELERSRRIPDLEAGIGARYLRVSEDTALVLGLSVPLPLFDRNQGAIAAAQMRLSQARSQERGALLEAKAALARAWQEMSAAHGEAEALRDEILPAVREALDAAEYGYQAGKFGILDVLDAQRTLVETRGRYLDALASFHLATAEMERLLGRELSSVKNDSQPVKE
jgi:cobalt-zinc-cadmium efflux system outer membrane protein